MVLYAVRGFSAAVEKLWNSKLCFHILDGAAERSSGVEVLNIHNTACEPSSICIYIVHATFIQNPILISSFQFENDQEYLMVTCLI